MLLPSLTLALAAAPGPSAFGQDLPANEGWVTDLADLLAPAVEAELEQRMESYRAGSGHEIALLTLPDLGGEPIERLALAVGRAWGIGSAETGEGALIVVAVAEREVRIEVARDLEGQLPDSIAGRIIRDVMVPHFKDGDYPAGLIAGVEAVHAALGGRYAAPAGEREDPASLAAASVLFFSVLAIIALAVYAHYRAGPPRGRRRDGASGRGGTWVSPWTGGGFGGGGLGGGGGGGGGFGGFGGGGSFGGGGATGRW